VAFFVPEAFDMGSNATSPAQNVMLMVLVAQAASGLVMAIVFWGLQGHVEAYSALLGSLTCVIPNAFLAVRLAATRRDAAAVLRAAWVGEVGKLGLTVILFIVIFGLVRPLAFMPLFAGFIVAQLMIFTGLFVTGKTKDGQ
jgi:ATP synthase protein I